MIAVVDDRAELVGEIRAAANAIFNPTSPARKELAALLRDCQH
jgi:hypothetical protein